MNEARYDALARLLPVPLLERRAGFVPLTQSTGDDRRAVYIAVTVNGYACYVGQTRRSPDRRGAAERRLEEHRQQPSKFAEWVGYWVLPLPHATPARLLDQSEQTVAFALGLPVRNRRWRAAQRREYGRPSSGTH